MQKSNAPTKLTVAFASGSGAGPVTDVPLTPSGTPGTASYQTGFTSVNMEPIASGGVPPFGADFNGVFQASTTAQIWQQAGYMWPYDSGFASNANIGGYPSGSVLMMGSGKGLWINQTDNNSQSPDATGSAGWLGIPAAGITTIATTGGTKTPDPSVLGVTTLLVSGALTSNATIVLPLAAGSRWIVANNTTGSFTLTVQGATGAGVAITQGSALTVFTDGTAYFAASANISGAYLPIDGTAVAATKLATPRAFSITGLATAGGINFDGTGAVALNVTALDIPSALGYTPANDASVVHIAGTETITGAKTFTGNQVLGQGDAGNICFNASATNPVQAFTSTHHQWYWQLVDSSGLMRLYHQSGTGTIGDLFDVDTAGNAKFVGGVTYTTSNATASDERLKHIIGEFEPRPIHRSVPFIEYELLENGWRGLGGSAQKMLKAAPEHVVHHIKELGDGEDYLGVDYTRAAYEQAMWGGLEVDRLTLRVAKLERALAKAKIEPRKRGFVRRMLEAIW